MPTPNLNNTERLQVNEMATGWIKIYRKIQECALWDDFEPFDRRSAWIDLLLLANHEDKRVVFNGKPITVKEGQRITSVRILAERWRWGKDRVRRFLELLETEGMITKESDNHRTLLTLVNYSDYQGTCDTDEYTNKHTHKHTHKDADGTQTGRRQDTNKNDKNDKNDKKDIYGEYHHVRLTESQFKKLCDDFGEKMARKAIDAVDKYVQETGKTYKDYNLTIRRWGIDAARKTNTSNMDDTLTEWIKTQERG